MFQLTPENYHSREANIEYMSVSQYKAMRECEAAVMAELRGEYVRETSDALLAGQMLHAWVESPEAYQEFVAVHRPLICKRDGDLKAQFVDVKRMIDTIYQDPFMMFCIQGEKEVIKTAEMFGTPWKIRMDVLNRKSRRLVDVKTTRSITELQWDPDQGKKVNFVEMYKYPLQAAVYAEVDRIADGRPEGDWYEPIIVAVSKEDPCDKAVISLAHETRFLFELELVKTNLPHMLSVKRGEIEPFRCGRCYYCRSTKVLDSVVYYEDLGVL